MADNELEAIRQRRMAELQASGGAQRAQENQEKLKQQQQAKQEMLNSILDQAARARLANLQCAKPEKAEMVTNLIMQLARSGRLPGKVTEPMLKDLLSQVSESMDQKTSVKFVRRRMDSDDDDDD